MSGKALQLTAALFVLGMALTAANVDARRAAKYQVGEKISDFAFKDDKGKTVRLSDYRGKVVVLNFFATW